MVFNFFWVVTPYNAMVYNFFWVVTPWSLSNPTFLKPFSYSTEFCLPGVINPEFGKRCENVKGNQINSSVPCNTCCITISQSYPHVVDTYESAWKVGIKLGKLGKTTRTRRARRLQRCQMEAGTDLGVAAPPERDALVGGGADELRRRAVAGARRAVVTEDVVLRTGALAAAARFQQAQRTAAAVVAARVLGQRPLPQRVVHLPFRSFRDDHR